MSDPSTPDTTPPVTPAPAAPATVNYDAVQELVAEYRSVVCGGKQIGLVEIDAMRDRVAALLPPAP